MQTVALLVVSYFGLDFIVGLVLGGYALGKGVKVQTVYEAYKRTLYYKVPVWIWNVLVTVLALHVLGVF